MKKQTVLTLCIGPVLLGTAIPAFADIAPLPDFHHININVSNDNGAQNGSGPSDSYYIKADGGGLNQLHISTSSANTSTALAGQVTTQNIDTSTTSGTFWVTTTGGRGYNDSIILLASVKGPISNDFNLSIKSSGYQWTAAANVIGTDIHYVSGAVNETFGKSDFLYGPQTTKPGPGTGILPFYSGQNVNDPATAEYLMFIDLWVGNTSTRSQTDAGSAKVEFSVSGLYSSTLAFNAYAFAYTSNTGANSIDWTNRVSGNLADAGQSGYSINSTAVAPVPVPAAIWLFGSALAGFGLFGRRKAVSA